MALPTYVAAGSTASGTGALTPGLPAGLATNDILILVVNNTLTTTADATLTTAESFVAITHGSKNSGDFGGIKSHQTLFWRRYDGTGAAPTVADNGEYNIARIYAFRGCETSGNPWDIISVSGDADGDSTLTAAFGASTQGADRLVAIFTTAFLNQLETLGSYSNSQLANITEQDDTSVSITGEEVYVGLVTGEKAKIGPIGTLTASWTTTGVYWVSASIAIALKPAEDPAVVYQDPLAGWYLASTSDQWTTLLDGSSVGNPQHCYDFNEPNTPVLDRIGSKNLALGVGDTAPEYQVKPPGFTRAVVKTASGVPTRFLNNTFANVNANSYTIMLIARTIASGTTRTIMRIGGAFDDDATLEITTTALQVGEGDGTRSVGIDSPFDGHYIYFLRVDDTGNQVDAFHDKTKIVGGTQACNGTELCYGGDNSQTWFGSTTYFIHSAVWTSALTDQQIEEVIDRVKNGPPQAGASDLVAPIVTVVSVPTDRLQPLVVEVEDESGLAFYELIVQDHEDAPVYVAYDSQYQIFFHPFGGRSTVTGAGTSADPYVFTLYRRGGWPTGIPFAVVARAFDAGGNVDIE